MHKGTTTTAGIVLAGLILTGASSRFIRASSLPAPQTISGIDVRSPFLAAGFSRTSPAFSLFAVDSLGGGRLDTNPILKEDPGILLENPGTRAGANPALRFEADGRGRFVYLAVGRDGRAVPLWTVSFSGRKIILRSGSGPGVEPLPFVLAFDQKADHATLLGLMKPGEKRVALPCVLHLPDMGSLRITASAPGLTLEYDARRYVKTPFVRIAFPAAAAAEPQIEYELEVAAIHPSVSGLKRNARYDGFRRSFLNLFQVNPRVQMLANNASSDPVPFTLYMDAMMAAAVPALVPGLTCLDLVRMTLDRYLAGAKGYGLVGYAVNPGEADLVAWKAPWNSLDAYPSLLLAACTYVAGSRDSAWAEAHWDGLAAWAREMMAADKDGNGLIEHPHSGNSGDRATAERRPSNWWDTINFGHEDAYANALAYKACLDFSGLARSLGRASEARVYADKAARLKSAYLDTFLNPASGLLAGWKSADGKLHDYAFTFVNGIAVAFELVEGRAANALMDRLLAKMREVGFSAFRYGLPGNLIPVRKEDYVNHNWAGSREVGEPSLEDGSDAFQFYENGGVTACYAYFTVKALYKLGRVDDARMIFLPMLRSYADGEFQGFCADGKSKDWRDWGGGCHGYEGLLCDGFLALLCVTDDAAAKR
ncbi:MAG: hypothetical protein PHI34_06205 [Acidobacteriota bacterium]|nr:hypothetical protein [Acidobacteriota bacterium]